MHDSFEKEVQGKMEELHLTPSAPVWEKIEIQLNPKERKRRFIFWFLFASLVLAGGGWWAYQSINKNDNKAIASAAIKPRKPIAVDSTAIVPSATSKPIDSISNAVSLHPIIYSPKQKIIKHPITVAEFKQHNDEYVVDEPIVVSSRTNNLVRSIVSAAAKQTNPTGTVGAGIKVETKNDTVENQIRGTDTTDQTISNQRSTVTDSTNKTIIKKTEALPVTNDSSLKRKTAASKGHWKKQINLSAGLSGYTEGAATVLYNAANLSQYPPSASVSNSTIRSQKTAAGPAFTIGFGVAKQVGKQWEISLGLQYAYYSTRTKVGERKLGDTTINYGMDKVAVPAFYTNSGINDYTNRFHAVELPVTIFYQPSMKLPLYLSVTAAYGWLLSTNALTYNNASNLYYQNSVNYVRTLLPVSTSLQYSLRSGKAGEIRIGPFAQYNLLKLRKENPSGKPHMSFVGIKAGINF